MPIVRISMWEGRTDEVKEKLISSVTKSVCDTIGCPPKAVEIVIEDVKKSNWGIEGKPATKIKP